MARNSVGASSLRMRGRGGIRRHREDDGVFVGERDGLTAEIERIDAPGAETDIAQARCSSRTCAPRFCKRASAGSISVALLPSRAISGRLRAAAGSQRFADHDGGQVSAEPCGGSIFSAASSNGSTSQADKAARQGSQ